MATASANPNAGLAISSEGRSRLQRMESMELRYYDDAGPGRGNCTFGVGIMLHRGPCTAEELSTPVSEADVEKSFNAALRVAESGVRRNVTHPLTQDQFDALVSYTFNRGVRGATPTFKLINQGDLAAAADNIERANGQRVIGRDGRSTFKIQPGLVRRRKEESAPFRVSVLPPVPPEM